MLFVIHFNEKGRAMKARPLGMRKVLVGWLGCKGHSFKQGH
jgi:hypothetical protein